MSKIDEFYNIANGKVYDTNGNISSRTTVNWDSPYDGQCVSLIKAYIKYGTGKCQAYGNAKDYWYSRATNGILNICDAVSGSPQDGDIIVSTGSDARYCHIYIYYKGQAFSQNVCNVAQAKLWPLSYQGATVGILRPKFMKAAGYSESQLIKEKGLATFRNDVAITIRRDTPTGAAYGTFIKGEQQVYTEKWVGNGHRYISWIHTNGVRCFAAVSGTEQRPAEGSSDQWATFSTVPEQSQPAPSPSKPAEYSESQLIKEKGLATFRNDVAITIRRDTPTGAAYGTFIKGEQQVYTEKWVGNGHRYISWIHTNGVRCFAAVSGTEQRPAEGSSDQWATFSTVPEQSQPAPSPSKPAETQPQPVKKTYEQLFDEQDEPGLQDVVLTEQDFEKIGLAFKNQVVRNLWYRSKCPYTMKNPKGIVIHNSGTPNAGAQELANSLNKEDTNPNALKSWHFQVDDLVAIESLPLNRNAFSVGDGANGEGNRNYIAIEICRDMEGRTERQKKSQENGARLAAVLLHKYGWTTANIKMHHDFKMSNGTYKNCPHLILEEENGWNNFLNQVQTQYDALYNNKEETSDEIVDKKENELDKKKGALMDLAIQLLQKLLSFFSK